MEIRSPSNEPSRPTRLSTDITRLNRETIRQGTPEPVDAEDLRAKLARQKEIEAQRIAAAREAYVSKRAQLARDKMERVQDAREKAAERPSLARETYLAERAQNARDVLAGKNSQDDADRISLSETSLRLRAHAARAGQGAEDESRAARIAELRARHESGDLNTDELIARAAFKLLSGE